MDRKFSMVQFVFNVLHFAHFIRVGYEIKYIVQRMVYQCVRVVPAKNCIHCKKFVCWFAILQWRKFEINLPTTTNSSSSSQLCIYCCNKTNTNKLKENFKIRTSNREQQRKSCSTTTTIMTTITKS